MVRSARISLVLLLLMVSFALGWGLEQTLRGRDTDGAAAPTAPQGVLWPDPKSLGPFVLEDHRGQDFGLEHLIGRWSFIFFGYTHCPDICPSTLALMNQVLNTLQPQHPDKNLQMLFTTLDPMRDDAETLQRYLHYFNKTFVGLGGELQQVLDFSKQIGIPYAYTRTPGGGEEEYHVEHPASLFLFDERGQMVAVLHPPHQVDTIVADFTAIRHFIDTQYDGPGLSFSGGWISEPPPGSTVAAGYLTITNHSDKPLQLTSAESLNFSRVELHENVLNDNRVRMRQTRQMDIPARGTLSLRRGGKHLMLRSPGNTIQVGHNVQLTLHFSDGTRSSLYLPVKRHGETTRHPPHHVAHE